MDVLLGLSRLFVDFLFSSIIILFMLACLLDMIWRMDGWID